MERSDESNKAIAYHEAGRAVLARNLELRVAWTTVEDAEGSHGHTELDDWWEQAEAPADIDWYKSRLAMFMLAGRESVAFFLGDGLAEHRTERDNLQTNPLELDVSSRDSTEAGQYVEHLKNEVRRLVAESDTWQAEIRAVADALIKERWLDSVRLDEVRAAGSDRSDTSSPETPTVENHRSARRASSVRRAKLGARFRR
jgi:hypothetical protein